MSLSGMNDLFAPPDGPPKRKTPTTPEEIEAQRQRDLLNIQYADYCFKQLKRQGWRRIDKADPKQDYGDAILRIEGSNINTITKLFEDGLYHRDVPPSGINILLKDGKAIAIGHGTYEEKCSELMNFLKVGNAAKTIQLDWAVADLPTQEEASHNHIKKAQRDQMLENLKVAMECAKKNNLEVILGPNIESRLLQGLPVGRAEEFYKLRDELKENKQNALEKTQTSLDYQLSTQEHGYLLHRKTFNETDKLGADPTKIAAFKENLLGKDFGKKKSDAQLAQLAVIDKELDKVTSRLYALEFTRAELLAEMEGIKKGVETVNVNHNGERMRAIDSVMNKNFTSRESMLGTITDEVKDLKDRLGICEEARKQCVKKSEKSITDLKTEIGNLETTNATLDPVANAGTIKANTMLIQKKTEQLNVQEANLQKHNEPATEKQTKLSASVVTLSRALRELSQTITDLKSEVDRTHQTAKAAPPWPGINDETTSSWRPRV